MQTRTQIMITSTDWYDFHNETNEKLGNGWTMIPNTMLIKVTPYGQHPTNFKERYVVFLEKEEMEKET